MSSLIDFDKRCWDEEYIDEQVVDEESKKQIMSQPYHYIGYTTSCIGGPRRMVYALLNRDTGLAGWECWTGGHKMLQRRGESLLKVAMEYHDSSETSTLCMEGLSWNVTSYGTTLF